MTTRSNGPKDSFFNLTLNSVEVSLFAHADVVDKIFGTDSGSQEREDLNNGQGTHGTGAVRDIMERSDGIEIGDALWVALQIEQHEGDWGESFLFSDLSNRSFLGPISDRLDKNSGAAGKRVKEISAPLAAEGISILFLSTYISDFILVCQRIVFRGEDWIGPINHPPLLSDQGTTSEPGDPDPARFRLLLPPLTGRSGISRVTAPFTFSDKPSCLARRRK